MKFANTAFSWRRMKERREEEPLRDPRDPTAARAVHEATHLPFRSWCAECAAGLRVNSPHRRERSTRNLDDHCFVRRDDESETVTILLMKDRYSRAIQAWVVERKGGYAARTFTGSGAQVQWQYSSQNPVMTWLVECVADIVTKYMQGMDGCTSYERLFGKRVDEEGLKFGDRILWRKHRSNDTNVVLDVQWAEEVWLGQLWKYNPSSYCCQRGS